MNSSVAAPTTHQELELMEAEQWVCWKYKGKSKMPISAKTGTAASTADSSTWSSYLQAVSYRKEHDDLDGVGFAFTEDDPYCGVDLDDCIDGDGTVAKWADEIVQDFGSYAEISPSNRGIKIFIRGTKQVSDGCKVHIETGRVEVYDQNRFFTFTGTHYGSPTQVEDRQHELDSMMLRLFPQVKNQVQINTVELEGSELSLSDVELLDKARNNPKFRRLFDEGDIYVARNDHSRADLMLCGMLAFWTGKNAERMDDLFRLSKLMRDKWDERRGSNTYGERTVSTTIKNCTNVYDPDYHPTVQSEVRRILMDCMGVAVDGDWRGRSGPSDRDVYKSLINTSLMYGKINPNGGGVRTSVGVRELAVESGIGRTSTVSKSLNRLEDKKLIHRIKRTSKEGASEFVIHPPAQKCSSINMGCVGTLSRSLMIRHASPLNSHYGTITKRNGHILDYVSVHGLVSRDELSKILGIRPRDLQRRYLNLLLSFGLIMVDEHQRYRTPDDINERLSRELEDSGCLDARKLQEEKYERERRAFRGESPELTPPNRVNHQDSQHTENDHSVSQLEEDQASPLTTNQTKEGFMWVQNYPPKVNGTYTHKAECGCIWCDEDAPEYIEVPINEMEVA